MKKTNILIICLLLVATVHGSAFAQGAKGLRINEVQLSVEDSTGLTPGWVEIYNTTHATVDIRGCYIATNPAVLTTQNVAERTKMMYRIPSGDNVTKIAPRQQLVIEFDRHSNRGPLHMSALVSLVPAKQNLQGKVWIGLFDANGNDLIDVVEFKATDVKKGINFARVRDGESIDEHHRELKRPSKNDFSDVAKYIEKDYANWAAIGPDKVSPGTLNNFPTNERIADMKREDPRGGQIAITAMLIVFCGLLVLFLCFRLVSVLSVRQARINKMKATGASIENAKIASGEVYAAIAMALHEAGSDEHDWEETVLTINRVKRSYSPWSSKIYTLRHDPRK